jgi:hypothetical protein
MPSGLINFFRMEKNPKLTWRISPVTLERLDTALANRQNLITDSLQESRSV